MRNSVVSLGTVWRWCATLAPVAILSACATPISLDHALQSYDAAIADSISQQLLINIARAHLNEPMHFTSVSNVAATYRFALNAGVVPAQTGNGPVSVPSISVSAEENPTLSLTPMQGDEFTQRLLTPFTEERLALVLQQGYDVDALLRLVGAETRLRFADERTERIYSNRPADPDGYRVYRQVMAQLSTIQDRHLLDVHPLTVEHEWSLAASAVTPESYGTTYKDYLLSPDGKDGWKASKRSTGRVVIANYPASALGVEERRALFAEADALSPSDILIDIRSGRPGGEIQMHGSLRLRSFHEILQFVGRGIDEEVEFDVKADPRTPIIADNPARTLAIRRSDAKVHGDALSIVWRRSYYSVAPDEGYAWNKKAFSLLYQLFQMSMSATQSQAPSITISK